MFAARLLNSFCLPLQCRRVGMTTGRRGRCEEVRLQEKQVREARAVARRDPDAGAVHRRNPPTTDIVDSGSYAGAPGACGGGGVGRTDVQAWAGISAGFCEQRQPRLAWLDGPNQYGVDNLHVAVFLQPCPLMHPGVHSPPTPEATWTCQGLGPIRPPPTHPFRM